MAISGVANPGLLSMARDVQGNAVPILPTARSTICAAPGRRGEGNLGRRYGLFVGDVKAPWTAANGLPCRSGLGMVAGGAPHLAAARCTGRPAGERFLDNGIASHPLFLASHPLFLASTPGSTMHMKKRRQQIRCGKKPLQPTEIPWCFSVAFKFSSEVAKEIDRISRFTWHWANEMWSHPEMAKVTGKMQRVLCRTLLNILYKVVQATNEPSSVDVDGTTSYGMKPSPETPRSFSMVLKLTNELTKEVVTIARFLWQWTEYIWSSILLRMIHGLVSTTNDPSSNDGATERRPVSKSNPQEKQGKARMRSPSKSPPPPGGTEHRPVPKSNFQEKQGPIRKSSPSKTPPTPVGATTERRSGSRSNHQTKQGAANTSSLSKSPRPLGATTDHRLVSKSNIQSKQGSDSTTAQPVQQAQKLWPNTVKSVKKTINKMAMERIWVLERVMMKRQVKKQKRLFTCAVLICICYYALKGGRTNSKMVVSCQLVAVEWKKALLSYNLREKLLQVGPLVCEKWMKGAEACKQVEESYNVSKKLLAAWAKLDGADKAADNLATIFTNMEKVYHILRKLTKGASP